MEEAARTRGLEVAGLQILLQVAREEADKLRLERNHYRASADEWQMVAKQAQTQAVCAAELADKLRTALEAAEIRVKQLERQGRRRSTDRCNK